MKISKTVLIDNCIWEPVIGSLEAILNDSVAKFGWINKSKN